MPDPLAPDDPGTKAPESPAPGGGITMLDAAALVTGAAVASVHFREFDEEMAGISAAGWALVVPAYAWLAVTAAGPFVYLVRRFGRRVAGYPGPDDRTWLGLGLPWAVAGLIRSGSGDLADGARTAYAWLLMIALALAAAPALVRTWRSLPRIEPTDPAPPPASGPTTWTARIGRALAVAWPIQIGLGLAVAR
jgi:hypothetical protein